MEWPPSGKSLRLFRGLRSAITDICYFQVGRNSGPNIVRVEGQTEADPQRRREESMRDHYTT